MSTETEPTPPSRRPMVGKAALFLVLTGLLGAGLSLGAMMLRPSQGPEVATEVPAPLPVSVMPVVFEQSAEVEDLFTGIAEARRASLLGFQAPGRIAALNVRIADRVRAGQVLARLDTRGLAAQLQAARAQAEEARAGWQLAEETAVRQETLQSRGHVSQQRVDEARAQAETALARVQSAEAMAASLEVQIDLSAIRAPFDGVITRRLADEGAIASPGQPVLELVENAFLEARIGLPARSVGVLEPGASYPLETEAGPVAAVLRSVTGVVDPALRTVTAVFEISQEDGQGIQVPAGSIVRLRMARPLDEDGFWIPVRALASASRGLWTVYVAVPDEDGFRTEARLVEVIVPGGEMAYVRGPFAPQEQVITDGLHRVVPGMRVAPAAPGREARATDG